MERQQQLLAAYQQIYSLSSQMIALAQTGRWEEARRTRIRLRDGGGGKTAAFTGQAGPSMALQEMLRNKLQQILDNETELKRLLQQRMDELKTLIEQSTRQNVVNNTYGQFHDRALLLLGNHRSDKIDNTDENGLNSTMRYYSRVTLGY